MFSFIKNWMNKENSMEEIKKDLQEGSTVDADEWNDSGAEVTPVHQRAVRPLVQTELSLHPVWEQQLDAEKKYTLRFLQAELPEMVEGTLGVTGFSLMPQEGGVNVAMFFRNASSHTARFKNVTLTILLDDKPFARQRFDLSDLGAIPPHSSRPWEVFFPAESFLHDNFAFTRWKVTLNFGKREHVWPKHLDLDPEMEARMTDRQKERLEVIVRTLPSMKPDSVEITGFDIGVTEDGKLVAGLLFRNALRERYSPQKLRIKITDAVGDLVASGSIDASKVQVRPGTARPWLVVFPASSVKKPNADLSRWYLEVKEANE
ncbi:SLAP domain-containing protein [Brevibacillus sp. H7]|uniref:SLAP domain-containing protein n=1 Tax=Brevibacillus sp. H7 TaxID=3349138 RepID=UPI0037FD2B0D